MEIETVKHEEIEIKIGDNVHRIKFVFRDGEMSHVDHNFNYKKTKQEWEFFAKAITIMLEKSKEFYKPTKDFKEGDIPF